MRKNGRLSAAIAAVLVIAMPCTHAETWRVGAGTGYSLADVQLLLKDQGRIKPGDTIVIVAGVYDADAGIDNNSFAFNNFRGEVGKPVVIKGELESDRPKLTGGISLNNSHHVKIENLDVSRQDRRDKYAAVAVSNGSSHIEISHLSVHHADVGVSFTDPGRGNSLRYSHIFRNDNHGVTSSLKNHKALNKPTSEADISLIESNRIEENGAHGIDLEASYWRVQKNRVLGNGWAYGGTSGIHLFSQNDTNADDVDCDYNEIFYNYVTDQEDDKLFDGNGIQIDHFCDNNVVAFNAVKNNDGAGISLLVGRNNTIHSNTSYHNAQHKNRAAGAYRGEIILISEEKICPNDVNGQCIAPMVTIPAQRGSGNEIYDNIVVTDQYDVPGIHVTEDFKNQKRNKNFLYVNWYSVTDQGAPLRWGDDSTWDIDGKTVPGNILAPVSFVDPSADSVEGLRLAAAAPNQNLGWQAEKPRADMGGLFPLPEGQGQTTNWGAFYLCSSNGSTVPCSNK